MTFDELARRARVDPDALRAWIDYGLLVADHGQFDAHDVERARLLRLATSRGLTTEVIAAASRDQGDLLGRFIAYAGTPPAEVYTLEEAAARCDVDPAFLHDLRVAGGLSDDELDDDDLAAIGAIRIALESGLPEEALLQLVRVYADCLGRVADAESRLYHFYVHDQLRAQGVDPAAIADLNADSIESLVALSEPTVLYFHRKGWARAMREDAVVHLTEDVAPTGPIGQLPVAVFFVDLAGYTPLTETIGDEAAAVVVDRFSHVVREEALHCEGRVVKQIGDEFMLVFPSAEAAIGYGLDLAARVEAIGGLPPLRMGVHTGTALYREADYLGATVNTAARVAAAAGAGQLVVTRAVRDRATNVDRCWEELGSRQLKGVSDPVELFAIALRPDL